MRNNKTLNRHKGTHAHTHTHTQPHTHPHTHTHAYNFSDRITFHKNIINSFMFWQFGRGFYARLSVRNLN